MIKRVIILMGILCLTISAQELLNTQPKNAETAPQTNATPTQSTPIQNTVPSKNSSLSTENILNDIQTLSTANETNTQNEIIPPHILKELAEFLTQNIHITENRLTSENISKIDVSTPTESILSTGNMIPTENTPQITIPSRLSLYTYKGQENYFYPNLPRRRDFDIDVSGFYQLKYSGRNYSPSDPSDPRWDRIIRDETYLKIPQDVANGDLKPETRTNIQITGKLNKDLSVHFDIEQEPDFPNKYDVRVNHKNKELQFFHFDTTLQDGEFIDIRKSLNGVRYTQKESQWETTLALGKERSDPKKFETYGNGSTIYSIGNQYILYGSVKVFVNNKSQSENTDYTINYFEGKITFKNPIKKSDYIEVIYEYTNPIQDFLPSLSRKNFTGAQFKYRSKDIVEINKISIKQRETVWPRKTTENIEEDEKKFQLEKKPIVLGSTKVKVNNVELENQKEFFVDHSKGIIFIQKDLSTKDVAIVEYEYYETEEIEEDMIGKNSNGPYILQKDKSQIIEDSHSIEINGKTLQKNLDYTIDKKGLIYFNYPIAYPTIINIKYKIIKITENISKTRKNPFNIGITYANESVKPEEDKLISEVTGEQATANLSIISTKENPLTSTEDIVLKFKTGTGQNDFQVLTPGSDYILLSAYEGKLQIVSTNTALNTGQFIIDYKYKKSFPTKLFFQADQFQNIYDTDNNLFIKDLPIKYNGVKRFRINNQDITNDNNQTSYQATYKENGNGLVLQFIRSSDGDRSSRLLDYPAGTVIMEYDYIPQKSAEGKIEQNIVGITVGKELSPKWYVQAETTFTNHNFENPQIPLKNPDIIQGIPNITATYSLSQKNIIEGSEKVYIATARTTPSGNLLKDSNNQFIPLEMFPLTKDDNYFINYVNGSIKLRNIILDSSKILIADYNYVDTNGNTKSGDAKQGYAAKILTEYKGDNLTLSSYYKNIDKNFVPIGTLKDIKGTEAFGTETKYRFLKNNELELKYNKRKRLTGIDDDSKDTFLYEDDLQGSTRIKWPLNTLSNHKFYFNQQIEDIKNLSATQNEHGIDILTEGLSNEITLGPQFLRTFLFMDVSKKINEFKDKDNPQYAIQNNEVYKIDSRYAPAKFPLIKSIMLNPSYYRSNSQTDFRYSNDKAYSNSNTYSLIGEMVPFQSLKLSGSYQKTQLESVSSKTATPDRREVLNTNYTAGFEPIYWFKTQYNINHSESQSTGVANNGTISDREQFNLTRFEPYGALVDTFNLKKSRKLLRPLRESFFTFSNTRSKEDQNNKLIYSKSEGTTYELNQLSLLTGVSVDKLSLSKTNSKLENSIITNTQQGYTNHNQREAKSAAISIKPTLPFLNKFGYTLYIENIKDEGINIVDNIITNDIKTTNENPRKIKNQKLSWSPGDLVLPIWKKKQVNFGNFSVIIQEDLKEEENNQIIEKIATADLALSVITKNIDSRLYHSTGWVINYSPFNLFSTSTTLKETLTNTKRTQSSLANIFVLENNIDFTANYQPIKWLGIRGTTQEVKQTKYAGPLFESSLENIKNGFETQNFTTFQEYTQNKSKSIGGGLTLTPLSMLNIFKPIENKWDISYGINLKTINTTLINQTTSNINTIDEIIYNIGTTIKPYADVNINYTYTFNTLTQTNSLNANQKNKGNTSTLAISYTPVKTKNFNVDIRYWVQERSGQLTNDLTRSETATGTGDLIQTKIEKTKTIETKASLVLSIIVPIKSQPFIENITFEGEGYFKTIKDKYDNDHAAKGQSKNSLSIGGILLKATINF